MSLSDISTLDHSNPWLAAEQAEAILMKRLTLFGSEEDWRLLCSIARSRILTLSNFHFFDTLISLYDQYFENAQLSDELKGEVQAAMFGMLVFRQPGHPDIKSQEQKCETMIRSPGNAYSRLTAANYLVLYRIWSGDLLGAETIRTDMAPLRQQTDEVTVLLLSYAISSMIHRLFLDYENCMAEIKEGLALADKHNIHHWDSNYYMQGAFLALSRNNTQDAQYWLKKMEAAAPLEHYLDRSGYHYCQAWCYSLENEYAKGKRHAEESIKLAELSGAVFPVAVTHMGLAQLKMDNGHHIHALFHIRRARKIGRDIKSNYVPFARGLSNAYLALKLGMHKRALRVLTSTLQLGREQNYVNFPWWRNEVMSKLCALALQGNIEPDYVRKLIRVRQLRPPKAMNKPNDWNWVLQLNVLSTPSVLLDGKPIELSGKGKGILMILACHGKDGQAVPRHKIIDALWGDAEGDKAEQALDTALFRLRKQLNNDELIIRVPGSLALDPGLCSVDLWWLQRWLATSNPSSNIMSLTTALMQQLSLMGDHDIHQTIPVSRLIRRYISQLTEYSQCTRANDEHTENLLCEAVEFFSDQEKLWQTLIELYLARGRQADAVLTFNRCKQTLQKSNLKPSAATQQLVEAYQ